jgi:hypothetical protein
MSTILGNGIIRDGQVVVEELIDLPAGSEITILGGEDNGLRAAADTIAAVGEARTWFAEIDFTTEDEQSNDPEVVQQWIDDLLRSIPPVPEHPEKEAEWRAWDEKMRQFNIEAVRKQFEKGTR